MQKLMDASISIAERVARQCLTERGLDADPTTLRAALNVEIEARFQVALETAKFRLAACVAEIAEKLFIDVMENAGREAVKKVGKPHRVSLVR